MAGSARYFMGIDPRPVSRTSLGISVFRVTLALGAAK